MLFVFVIFIYILTLSTTFISDKPFNDTNNDSIVCIEYLLQYERICYFMYMVFYFIYNGFDSGLWLKNIDSLTISLIKLFINTISTINNVSIIHHTFLIWLSWCFTAPSILNLFGNCTNTNMIPNIYMEIVMHIIHLTYRYIVYIDNTHTLKSVKYNNISMEHVLMFAMYCIYMINMFYMMRIKTSYKYYLLFGWIIIGTNETFYILNFIDDVQHLVYCIINDIIFKGFVFTLFTYKNISQIKAINQIQLHDLQVMYEIHTLITRIDNPIIRQIKYMISDVLENKDVIIKSRKSMSEMVYCKDFSPCFTKRILRSKSITLKNVFVLFSDIVQYSEFCNQNDTHTVILVLNELYKRYDDTLSTFNTLQKIENIGDCYFITSKLEGYVDKSEALKELFLFSEQLISIATNMNLNIRIGIHYGDVSVGIIGKNIPRFAIVGKNVNIAARLESTSEINSIHISEAVYNQLDFLTDTEPKISFIQKNNVELKNIGNFTTYTYKPNNQFSFGNTLPDNT